MQFLKDWKKRGNRKPLIIRGACQVGKTWLQGHCLVLPFIGRT